MATNLLPNTAMLSIRLDADALAAFDSFAVGRGGRSAVLRQMIERTLQESAGRPFIDRDVLPLLLPLRGRVLSLFG